MYHQSPPSPPQVSIVDIFFPGFTGATAALRQLLDGNLDSYAGLLCICGLLVFCGKLLSRTVGGFVGTYLTSKTDVYDPDEAYDMLESWVSVQDFSRNAISSLARVDSRPGRAVSLVDSDIVDKKPLRFTPWGERLSFWYKGHRLTLQCTQNESSLFPRKSMTISCIGRSSKVLRDLMNECRLEYLKRSEGKTSIFEHHNNGWKKTTTRDVRPIETVIMNEELKQILLEDVRSFLDPEARSWYANRGLPYRRGYLMYGRPGTGKSSLSMSVAGCFGLDIYVVSLAAINDGHLNALFRELPQRCVVLLEDVDAVGTSLSRDIDADDLDSGSDVSRRSPKSHGSVSLSGLLNVLDGVASQDGRVLIMTTNHIEHLDDALIRSGRVDKKIEFQLADAVVARKLFCHVFEQSIEELLISEKRESNNQEVRQLAVQFASLIPELEFSPADILSFLLANRDSPSGVLAEVEEWVSSTRGERALRRGGAWVQSD
ncbi:mitochondrial chaperone bcs1 [Colletotrichum godetiae]|uniref:Mitochondrial chaperone bcs1 n=1 Tax=Colletotrichum godetiae TaxID=1209918 RepID=A0AAJ0AV91_9PEZI|nr:mitochondrial chaperone bcs1 [Colletotrichum godetiae]KAK1690428.1 mitochondrial chaperone bcs1 [Colletotrichum godetiae]